MKLTRRLQPLNGPIDMAPLVTVVLLLLAFFLLSSPYIMQPGIQIDLPRSLYGRGTQSNRLIVTLLPGPERHDDSGVLLPRQPTIFFDDQLMGLTELQRALNSVPHNTESHPLLIKSDKDVPLGFVTEIVNAAMASGLSAIIATQQTAGSNGSEPSHAH
jgi:biopolymer transport protein ExbD